MVKPELERLQIDNVSQRQPPEKRRPIWLGLVSITSVAAGTVLWTLGSFGTPQPVFLAVLLGLTLVAGIVSLLAGSIRLKAAPAPALAAMVLGLAGMAAGIAFVILIFANDDGPLPIFHGAETPHKSDRLRVLIFNVLGGYPELDHQEARFRDTLTALRALDPDVLILQEAWQTHGHGNMAQRVARALKMDHVYARANGGARMIGFEEGAAVISRYPIVEAKRLVLSPRWPPYETRIAVIASIDLGRETVVVAGVHLSYWDDATTAAQTQDLLARLPGHDLLLVAGDFNATSDSPAVKHMLAADFADKLPGGIDHLFVPMSNRTRWSLHDVRWTFRPEDMPHLIHKETALSDHPGIVADFVRRRG